MSLSEALGSFPVIRHFYPIDPETSSQQQSLVYNSPSAPLVAPIGSFSYPQPRELRSRGQSKRTHEEDEQEMEASISNSSFRRRKRAKNDDSPESYEKITSAIILPPKTQRSQAYVEIPVPKSFVRTLYRPMSSDDILNSDLGQQTSRRSSRLLSQTPMAPSRPPATSNHSYDPDSDDPIHSDKRNKRKDRKAKEKTRQMAVAQAAVRDGDDGSTCHQCRRKTPNVKMRCRNVRASGDVCTLFFCESCLKTRYGEAFHPFHLSWECPRCRGTCNCSLCLRKAGLGYILDALSEQLPGARGRLSCGKSNGKGKGTQLDQINVREWLARRGLMLGTDEWMETQRQRGVRYFVGASPPSFNDISPYKEMRLNPTLVALDDEQEHPGTLLDRQLAGEGADGAPLSSNAGDSARLTSSADGMGTQFTANANLATSSMTTDPRSPPITLTKDVSPTPTDANLPALYGDTEDLPGLTLKQTRPLRLVVGRPLPLRLRKKYHLLPTQSNRYGIPISEEPEVMDDDSDYASSGEEPTNHPSALHIHNKPVFPSLNYGEMMKYEEPETKSSCGSGGSTHGGMSEEPRASSPPPEPVFVPTEHYTPSKLDLSHVKDPDAGFGSSLWMVDAHGPESIDVPQSHVLLSYAALDDVDLSPSHTEITAVSAHQSVSTSATRTPGDYLTGDTGYAAGGLSSFEALNETWIPSEGPLMEGGMPPLRMEHLFSDAD